MGPDQNFLTRVEWDQIFVAQVGSDKPSLVWVWKISPKNPKFFNFCPSGQKEYHQVGSKSTWVKGTCLLWAKSMLRLGSSLLWLDPTGKVSHSLNKNYTIVTCTYNILELFNKKW